MCIKMAAAKQSHWLGQQLSYTEEQEVITTVHIVHYNAFTLLLNRYGELLYFTVLRVYDILGSDEQVHNACYRCYDEAIRRIMCSPIFKLPPRYVQIVCSGVATADMS